MKNKINLEKFDKNNFIGMLKSLPYQVDEIVNNRNIIINYLESKSDFNKILICGMGGSAIGGDFIKSVILNNINHTAPPIYVNRDYDIPNWVDSNTFIILSSYSGNTEEVLSCYNQCKELNSFCFVMTSGGSLLDIAINEGLPYSLIPKGYMPRQALGYSVSILSKVLFKYGMIDDIIIKDLNNSIESIIKQSEEYSVIDSDNNKAINLAHKIFNKFNIIYTSQGMEVIGSRFRAQLAENAKILSSHFIFPEQNHNEIEGFQNLYFDNINIIWINDIENHRQISKRMKITKKLLTNVNHIDISFDDSNYLKRQMKLINFLDWVSYYCAIKNEVDPYPVDVITELKDLL